MAMLPTCPTCGLTYAAYLDPRVRACSDPWHANDYFSRKDGRIHRRKEIEELGRPRERAIDKEAVRISNIQARAQQARDIFEKDLAAFVKRWAPDNLWDRDNFQRDLMMLMRDAMEHKSMTFGLHLEQTESTLDALSMHASASTRAIYPPPSDRLREFQSLSTLMNDLEKPKGE